MRPEGLLEGEGVVTEGYGLLGVGLAAPEIGTQTSSTSNKKSRQGFSRFSPSGGRFRAPGPSKGLARSDPGWKTNPREGVERSGGQRLGQKSRRRSGHIEDLAR